MRIGQKYVKVRHAGDYFPNTVIHHHYRNLQYITDMICNPFNSVTHESLYIMHLHPYCLFYMNSCYPGGGADRSTTKIGGIAASSGNAVL